MAPTSAGPKTLGGVVVDDSPGGVVDYMRNMTEDDFTNWCVCMIEMQEKMGYVNDPGLPAEVDELIRFLKDAKKEKDVIRYQFWTSFLRELGAAANG